MGRPAENPPKFELPDESEFGPKMKACTPKERAFVIALGMTGANGAKAAMLAGDEQLDSAAVYAHRALQRKRVREAMQEWAVARLHSGVMAATEEVLSIAKDRTHPAQWKAIERILGQSGIQVAQKIELGVTVEHKDTAALVREIRQLAVATGVDARMMLAQAGVPAYYIDAEFVEVAPALPAPSSSAGLEDLL